ncbi:MAG: LysR family transcriptional regulator [Pseudomonadota bacterium]
MDLPKLALPVFDAFERVARLGSMQGAAREMGLSVSTVSHHVARLEHELGVTLLDRRARPFVLTQEGEQVVRHVALGLQHFRQATRSAATRGLGATHAVRIGFVEDLESTIAPDLAAALARQMPHAALSIETVLSHQAPSVLEEGRLDAAVVAEWDMLPNTLKSHALLNDPFVMALPAGASETPSQCLVGDASIPFLRFNPRHLIGRQIEAQLARNGVALEDRLAFDSAQSMMAIVANADGWAILTPLGFARARRYAADVALHPLPLPAFARRISLLARHGLEHETGAAIAAHLRLSLEQSAVAPIVSAYPWLQPTFRCL